MMVRRLAAPVALSWALLAPTAATAQTTGRLGGALTDENGNPVIGGAVEIINTSTHAGRTTTTDRDGRYEFPPLLPA
jgi:protocatechuate 3,4-dioxygenase beta subunit